eukprot:5470264-Heterocapsa_arctica.AAC.1
MPALRIRSVVSGWLELSADAIRPTCFVVAPSCFHIGPKRSRPCSQSLWRSDADRGPAKRINKCRLSSFCASPAGRQ